MSAPVAPFLSKGEQAEHALNLLVEGMHCPSCVAIIEGAMQKHPEVVKARLNLSTRRLRLEWNGAAELGQALTTQIDQMGYRAMPFDAESAETQEQRESKFLLRTLAVAGFASGNLMLFSIPMWTADAVEMGGATRNLFQWIQVFIAIPAILYCGLPFFRSAWLALKERRTNMDVPISVAVILTTLMSLFEIWHRGYHSYLDSAVMLLFFLLIGRYLDAAARGRARGAAQDLLKMMQGFATRRHADGRQETIPLSEIKEGMELLVAAGEKIGADGTIQQGVSELDTSLITGETLPQKTEPGSVVFAGMLNLSAPLVMRVTRAGERSLLSQIVRLMEHAEQGQARYVSLADRISGWYTPVVHLLALAAFLGWWLWGGMEWQPAVMIATTVLIITCPCALGLAVPVVQVLATGKLMRRGILVKSGNALERLSTITDIVWDKTGTLTLGKPELEHKESIPADVLQLAASMAAQSKHPLSQAVARAYAGPLHALEVSETPGQGLQSVWQGRQVRLGRAGWCNAQSPEGDTSLEMWLSLEGQAPQRFTFADQLRADAAEVLARFTALGIRHHLLSGDRAEVAQQLAEKLAIGYAEGGLTPLEKCSRIEALKKQGSKVLMVGDGLNDAPSLATADVSISPASAMDITQNAADIVFQGQRLKPVLESYFTSGFAEKLVKQNFLLSIGYNVVAIPLAVMGYVTPLVAAVAMSSSSLLVIGNAFRLKYKEWQ